MTAAAKLHPMGQSVSVPLAEVVECLDAQPSVHIRLATSTNRSGDRILRDLVVTIIPQPLLQNGESPLDALQWEPFEYETSDRSYIILQARSKSEQLRRWMTGQEREATLLEFDPRPGRQSLALSFAMPALQETASAVRMPSGTPWGFEPLTWPSTTYECYAIPEPGRMPQDVSSTDAYELVLSNTWDPDDVRSYRDFNAARVELIHGLSDPRRAYSFSDTVTVRVVHPDGWLQDSKATPTTVEAMVCGIDGADFTLQQCRVHVEEGQQTWGKSRIVPKAFQRISFALPAQPPIQATLVLTRSSVTLDRAVVTCHEGFFPDDVMQLSADDLPEDSDVDAEVSSSAPHAPFEVVLSFAGEERPYVESVARYLKEHGVTVFYDADEEVHLWGKDLVEELGKVYAGTARYCVMFISQHYVEKNWPRLERRNALAKAMKEKAEYVLPARFDDSEVPGLVNSVATVNLKNKTPGQLGALILKKLGRL